MKCHCCNATMASDEIKHEPKYGKGGFAPCGTCLAIIEDLFNDATEEEIDRDLNYEIGELFYENNQGTDFDAASNVHEEA